MVATLPLLVLLSILRSVQSSYGKDYVRLTFNNAQYAQYSGVYVRGSHSTKCGVNYALDEYFYQPTYFYEQYEGDAYLYNDGSPVSYPTGELTTEPDLSIYFSYNRLILTSTSLNGGTVGCADVDTARDFLFSAVGKFSLAKSDFTGIVNGAGGAWDIVWRAENGTETSVTICDSRTDATCTTTAPTGSPTKEPSTFEPTSDPTTVPTKRPSPTRM